MYIRHHTNCSVESGVERSTVVLPLSTVSLDTSLRHAFSRKIIVKTDKSSPTKLFRRQTRDWMKRECQDSNHEYSKLETQSCQMDDNLQPMNVNGWSEVIIKNEWKHFLKVLPTKSPDYPYSRSFPGSSTRSLV